MEKFTESFLDFCEAASLPVSVFVTIVGCWVVIAGLLS